MPIVMYHHEFSNFVVKSKANINVNDYVLLLKKRDTKFVIWKKDFFAV